MTFSMNPQSELSTCRMLAPKCVFVLGFGRSNTTIVTNMINTSPLGCITGEANFYLQNDSGNFREAFNSQHRRFRNQASKSTYVPDLSGGQSQHWWEWLAESANFFPVIGDKMAFSAHQFDLMRPEDIQAFFEARFFTARYVFVIRDPTTTLLSVARLLGLTDDVSLHPQIDAWLRFIQLWADWIRIFPHTLTLLKISETEIKMIENFIGIKLENAQYLFNKDLIRKHKSTQEFRTLNTLRDDIQNLFDYVKLSLEHNRAIWQKEQKRSLEENNTLEREDAATLVAPTSLGHVWTLAEALRDQLRSCCVREGSLP